MTDHRDDVEFDDVTAQALAASAGTAGAVPGAHVKARLLARVRAESIPEGFSFRFEADNDWVPHPVAGIRMKVLAHNLTSRYVTLLLDVAPGTRFPPHRHSGAEECYVVSGSLFTLGRRLGPGDFVHAEGATDHSELYTEEGCRVILIVPPEDYLPA